VIRSTLAQNASTRTQCLSDPFLDEGSMLVTGDQESSLLPSKVLSNLRKNGWLQKM
jgi:hypothetical protein